MLRVVFLLGQSFTIDSVDIDGGEHLCAIDAIVVVTDYLHIGQVGLEATFQKYKDVLLICYLLALLFDPLLLYCQFFDPIGDLVSNSSEVSAYLFIILQDLEVLSDGLEEGLSKLTDFVSINDTAFEEFFTLVDEDTVSVLSEPFSKGTLEDLEIDLIGEVAFEGG